MEAVKALAGTDPQASWTFICDGLNTHKSEALVRFVAEACAHQRPLTGGGDMSFFTVFVIMAINMILAFVLLFASVKINCMNIRNAAKMELNNVSARIYADTFHAQMEHYSTNSTYAIGEDSVGASTVLSEATTENIGKYGRMRREYLQEYQPEFYNLVPCE